MHEIKVTVVDYSRRNLMLRYIDPLSGKQKSKSAGTARHSEAVKAAGKWEAELREGRYAPPSKTTWQAFIERYADEVLASLADKTHRKTLGVFRMVESLTPVQRLVDLTAERISGYQSKLRDAGKSESTIKSHLAHLKAALRWAERVGLLVKAPRISMPKRAKSSKGNDPMKGRPITTEEFERMLDKVEAGLILTARRTHEMVTAKRPRKRAVTAEQKAAATERHRKLAAQYGGSWRHYLRGLWLSGLRLSESLTLSWDESSGLCVSLTGKYPMLLIPAEAEKGNRDRVLPMSPDFARWLLETPHSERTGFVFKPLTMAGTRAGADRAMRTVAAIGEAAGVKVRNEPVKFASAHDLRRSFGERWASKVMPQVLMEIMRHESIDTTLRFYVGRNAETTAAVLWNLGNTSGNSEIKRPSLPIDNSKAGNAF